MRGGIHRVTRTAPERIETARLVLRRPTSGDAAAIFERYSSDPAVTRYLGWPRHESVDDTAAFLAFSDTVWHAAGAGPFLILKPDGRLLGSTGLIVETPHRAVTGYVLARDAWGSGYATEALMTMVGLAQTLFIQRLEAQCHPEHTASMRVLEKCGFMREARLASHTEFPNLDPGRALDVLLYARALVPRG